MAKPVGPRLLSPALNCLSSCQASYTLFPNLFLHSRAPVLCVRGCKGKVSKQESQRSVNLFILTKDFQFNQGSKGDGQFEWVNSSFPFLQQRVGFRAKSNSLFVVRFLPECAKKRRRRRAWNLFPLFQQDHPRKEGYAFCMLVLSLS